MLVMPVAIVMAVVMVMLFVFAMAAIIIVFVLMHNDDFSGLWLAGLRSRFLAADRRACRAAYGTADDRAIASAHCRANRCACRRAYAGSDDCTGINFCGISRTGDTCHEKHQ